MDLTDRQLEILTYTVLGEAAGEGREGRVAGGRIATAYRTTGKDRAAQRNARLL